MNFSLSMLGVVLIGCLVLAEHEIVSSATVVNKGRRAHSAAVRANTSNESDEVIELNVGGQKMTTLRSTLTVIPHSILGQMFRADAKKARPLLRDKDGSIFFDHNPIYFSYLLDQLRAIKRMPKRLAYQHQFSAPFMISPSLNFTHMLVDLGLTASDLLSPMEGTHRNLTVKSLVGWQECYRSTYDVPFNASILTTSCNGSRLLVGCRPVENRNILTLAGIGQREDVFHPCLPKPCRRMNRKFKKTNRTRSSSSSCSASYQCITQAKRGVGWYDVGGQAWGFVRGSLSFSINPCDASDLDADYRLCWTMKSDEKQVSSDRCGSAKNLQASKRWERVIYHID